MLNPTSHASLHGPTGDPQAIDRLRRWGGEPLVREMSEVFTREVPRLLAVARAGAAHGDWPSVEGAAHTLKASCAQMGSARMSRICAEVEALAAGGSPTPVSPLLDLLHAEFASFATWLDTFRNQSAGSEDE